MCRSTMPILTAALLVVSLAGCTRQERSISTEHRADTLEGTVPATDGSASTTGGGSPDTAPPPPSMDTTGAVSGTLAELRQRLTAEARSLDRAVAGGRLDEVTARSLRTRDIVVALAGKATALPSATAQHIDSLVAAVTQVTEAMRGHAARRELDGVRSRNTELQAIVARIVTASAPAR